MKWVLIFYVLGPSATLTSSEFGSLRQCTFAGEWLKKQNQSVKSTFLCLEKK